MPDAEIRKVGLFTVREGRVLLCRKRHGKLILPGGKREPGETSLETLHREIAEELGSQVRLIEPTPLGTYIDRTAAEAPETAKTIEIELYGGILRGEPQPSNEIHALLWFGDEDPWLSLAPSLSGQIFPDLIRRGLLHWGKPGLP